MQIVDGFDWSFREWTTKSIEDIIRSEFKKQGPAPIADYFAILGRRDRNIYIGKNNIFETVNITGDVSHTPVADVSLTSTWYPISIFMPETVLFNGKYFDETSMDGYTSPDGKIKIKYENVTFAILNENNVVRYRTEKLIVCYYNIAGVPIIGSGNNAYYDIYNDLNNYIPLRNNNSQKIFYSKTGFNAYNHNSLTLRGTGLYSKYAYRDNLQHNPSDNVDAYEVMNFTLDCTFDIRPKDTQSYNNEPINITGLARLYSEHGVDTAYQGASNKCMLDPIQPFLFSHVITSSTPYGIDSSQVTPFTQNIVDSNPQGFYFSGVGEETSSTGIASVSASEFNWNRIINRLPNFAVCFVSRFMYAGTTLQSPIQAFDFTSQISYA